MTYDFMECENCNKIEWCSKTEEWHWFDHGDSGSEKKIYIKWYCENCIHKEADRALESR